MLTFVGKLTAAGTIGESCKDEVVGVGFSKGADVEPGYGLGERLRRSGLDRTFEELFESFEETWAVQLGAQVSREALLPLKDAYGS